MSDILTVVLNSEPQLHYDRGKPLAERQREYLQRMDRQMDGGIELEGSHIAYPDELQRARFVAIELVRAIAGDDGARAAAMTSYLANRLPELKQVKIALADGEASIDLVFDEPHTPQLVVNFVPRDKPKPH